MADIKIDSDSGKFKAGADQDLEVYNDGSHSYISGVTASQNMVFATRPSGGSTTTAVTIDSSQNATFVGNIDVDGTANLDVVDIDGAVDITTGIDGYAMQMTNVHDGSEGLLVRTTDNDSGEYILRLQSSGSAVSESYSDRFLVNKSGNVGIGESSALYAPLTVAVTEDDIFTAGSVDGINIILMNKSTDATCNTGIKAIDGSSSHDLSAIIFGQTGQSSSNEIGHLEFWTSNSGDSGNTEKMRITSAGNVGIGTDSPGYQLDLRRNDTGTTTSLGIRQIGSGDASMAFQTTTSPYGFCIGVDGSDSDAFKIATGNDDVGTNTRLKIEAGDGTVAIPGTLAIGGVLAVAEYIRHDGDSDTEIRFSAANNIEITAGSHKLMRFEGNAQEVVINEDQTDIDFRVETADASHTLFCEGSTNRVGIGTSSPATFLEVNGGGASGATMIIDNTASPNRLAALTIDGDNGSGDGGASVSLSRNGTMKWNYYTRNNTIVGSAFSFALLDAGNDDGVYINQGGSGWTDASDERLKTSFVPIENAVDKLNTLQAINFKWKYGSEERQTKNNIGLLAQEVYEVFPEAVDYHDPEDFKLIDHPTIEGTKQAQGAWGIDKSKLIPVLVKAVQELSTANDALKSRIEALENA